MTTQIPEYDQSALDFLQRSQTEFLTEFKTFDSMPFDEDGTKRNIFKVTLKNGKHSYSFDFGSSIADSCKTAFELYSHERVEIYCGFIQGNNRTLSFSHTIKTSYPILRNIHEGKTTIGKSIIINDAQLKKDYFEYTERVEQANKTQKKYRLSSYNIYSLEKINELIQKNIHTKIQDALTKHVLIQDQADEIKHPSAYSVLACLQKYEVGTFENFCSEFGYDTDSRKAVRTYKAVRKEWANVRKLFTDSEIEQLQEIN